MSGPDKNNSNNESLESQIKNSKVERLNWGYLKKEFGNFFFLEKGFVFTIKELLTRPALTIQTYLFKDRAKYTKPVTFLILSALIYTICRSFLFTQQPVLESASKDPILILMDWQDRNWGYCLIFYSLLCTFCVKLFFWKSPYNLFEIFIANIYVFGMMILWTTFGDILFILLKETAIEKYLMILFMFSTVLYMVWALGTFLRTNRIGFIKVFLAIVLGILSFVVLGAGLLAVYLKI